MDHNLMERYLSRPRFQRYLEAMEHDHDRALQLYRTNLSLAKAFHPLLGQFEVVLRNALNVELSSYFEDDNWLLNQRAGFMSDPQLATGHTPFFLRRETDKAIAKIGRNGRSITHDDVLAAQTFGFWISLFSPVHYRLIGGRPIQIFTQKPPDENRLNIYKKLSILRKFRNRISHNEPICFRRHRVSLHNAHYRKALIYELMGWMDPSLIRFFATFDTTKASVKYLKSA